MSATVSAVWIYMGKTVNVLPKNKLSWVLQMINTHTQNVGVLVILLFVCVHVFT